MNRSARCVTFLAAVIIGAVFGLVSPCIAPHGQTTKHSTKPEATSRRWILESIFYTYGTILTVPSVAVAQEAAPAAIESATTTKPYATLDALLPAARVKLVIDKSVIIASEFVNGDTNSNNKKKGVEELQDLLLKPQNYTRSSTLAAVPQRPAKQYLDTYKKNIDRLNLLEMPAGMLVQSGEIDTWKRLKRQERARERDDEIRAAFNTYTTNLSFSGDSYQLNVPKQERSRMIRDDALPEVTSVIASDIGLRYLLRNDVLTYMEDARAELQYQLRQNDESFVATDLLEILRQAQTSCDKWFSLIDKNDVMDALDQAKRQEKQA